MLGSRRIAADVSDACIREPTRQMPICKSRCATLLLPGSYPIVGDDMQRLDFKQLHLECATEEMHRCSKYLESCAPLHGEW